jgi:hypothetical protein
MYDLLYKNTNTILYISLITTPPITFLLGINEVLRVQPLCWPMQRGRKWHTPPAHNMNIKIVLHFINFFWDLAFVGSCLIDGV